MRFRIIAVVAAFSILATAGIANANGEDTDPRIDTLFTYGYDAQTQLFFSNTHEPPKTCHLSIVQCSRRASMSETKCQVVLSTSEPLGVDRPQPR